MNRSRSLLRSLALVAALLPAGVLLAGAQGRIVGKVTDGKGTPLEGVKVTITTPSILNFKIALTTDKEGKWGTILNDSTLRYRYKFEKQGFIGIEQEKKVPIGTTEDLSVQLLTQDQAIEKGLVKQVVDPYTAAYNEAVDKFKAGDLDGALESAHKAIELGPDKAGAFSMAATVALQKKDWDHVIEFGEKALALEPDNPPMYGYLANAHRAKGNAAKASEYEKKFASANPDKPEVLYNQAVELYNKGDFKGAEPVLRKVVEVKPDYAEGHFLLGMTCVNLNKIPDMKKHLGEYLKLAPNGKDAGTAKEMLDAFK